MTGTRIAAVGALLAALGIAFGAFGAHALRATVDAQALGWWETGSHYLLLNALGLVALGAVPRRLGLAALLIGLGAILFAASLYAMTLTGLRWLGMVTPVGGTLMIAGWLLATWRLVRSPAL